jgi:hypothetical protein
MGRQATFDLLKNGESMGDADVTALRLPALAATSVEDTYGQPSVRTSYVAGPVNKVTIAFNAHEITVDDTPLQGVATKLLDFPLGIFRIKSAYGKLIFTTTSVIADTLNASKVLDWSVGTKAYDLVANVALAGAHGDIIPVVAATSSATIDTANTATVGRGVSGMLLNGATTAADVYLNVSIPTAGDIDADATVGVTGTITIEFEDLGLTGALANATRMPSAIIWANCPWEAIKNGEVDGHYYWNDFTGNIILANAQTVTDLRDGVMGFTAATAGTTINKVDTAAPYGKVKLETTTINEDAGIMIGGGNNVVGEYVFSAGKQLWFEARVSILNVTVTKLALLVAFAEEALCATTATLAAGGATIADKDYIGFHKRAADTVGIDVVHNTAGGGGETILAADSGTFAADTFTKLGIYCDGTTIFFYQDGTLLTSVALSATNVPDGEEMALYIVLAGAHGDTCSAAIDWIKIAQRRA